MPGESAGLGEHGKQPSDQLRLLQRVAALFSLFCIGDEVCLLQDGKMLADIRLGALKQFPYVLHTQRAILQYFKDGQSGRVCQRFQVIRFCLQIRT